MRMANAVTNREVQVIQIPAGEEMTLPEGIPVTIVQKLGGNYTVQTPWGYLVRIARADADAIGQEVEPEPEAAPEDSDAEVTPDQLWEKLKQVYDPEIPVNIVELGLIYELRLDMLEAGGTNVKIEMTLTAPGCGMGEVLVHDVQSVVSAIPGVRKVDVDLVWEPIWNPEMMSDAAKLELGFL